MSFFFTVPLRIFDILFQFSVSHYLAAAESFLFILKFISIYGIMGIYCKWKRIDGVDFHIAETLNLKNKLESHLFIRLWKDFIKSKAEMKRNLSQWCKSLLNSHLFILTQTLIAFCYRTKKTCIIFHVIFLGCAKLPSASKACNFVLFCHIDHLNIQSNINYCSCTIITCAWLQTVLENHTWGQNYQKKYPWKQKISAVDSFSNPEVLAVIAKLR